MWLSSSTCVNGPAVVQVSARQVVANELSPSSVGLARPSLRISPPSARHTPVGRTSQYFASFVAEIAALV